jgi:hypothetical protein
MLRRRRSRKSESPKEKKKKELLSLIDKYNFWFEEAVTPRLDQIDKELKERREITDIIQQGIKEFEDTNQEYDENGRPSESYLNLFEELGEFDYETHLLLQQKLSIEEMKIVCLYKEFEILIKEIIVISFPGTDVEQLYKWDNIKSLLSRYEILIGDIKHHNQINELRVVNNNIKHSSIIDDKVSNANIIEFELKEEFDCESLTNFYIRISGVPVKFLKSLTEKIVEYLFVFDEERIEKIACQYEGRMDESTATKLAEKIIEKCT